MSRLAGHTGLTKAKKGKNDEFYTQRVDIERELMHYAPHFEGKTVYCNTDDHEISHFVKYFQDNFQALKLKKVIATSFEAGGVGKHYEFDGIQTRTQTLHGDGDFRSQECLDLLYEADIVVTNPPFSLFREFVGYMDAFEKKYLVIGNINAITYKEIFKLIQKEKAWLGINLGRGISGFIVPENYELYGTEAKIDEHGNRVVSSNNCLWLTNLDHKKRHEDIPLVKSYEGNEELYPTYDNLNGINVSRTKDIPADYMGLMGVPITFLHKRNPEQFDLIRFRKGDDGKDLAINGKAPYFRIVIRRAEATGPLPKPKGTSQESLW